MDGRGWGMFWVFQPLATTQPGLNSHMIQTLNMEGNSLMACSLEMLISALKLLGGSFEISGSPDFISFSPLTSI